MATPGTQKKDALPVVALVGRVNVGKSTLFNRLIEEQKAIVSPTAGTTRTANEGIARWRGKEFRVIDTGGLTFDENVLLEDDIIAQSEKAVGRADLIIFVTDARIGILPQEKELAKILRVKKNTPVILVANKVDTTDVAYEMEERDWQKLGLGRPFHVSATNGRNMGDMMDLIFSHLAKLKIRPKNIKQSEDEHIRVTIIGKPNVGKSSLFNKIIGEEKVIVSDMPHTTREPHDTDIEYEEVVGKKKTLHHITFVDTAGIRRKANVEGTLERSGIMKSIEAIESSDIVLFVLDASEDIASQDRQLAGLLEKRSKSVVILLNKWDLATDNTDSFRNEVKARIWAHFPHISFAPILFVSGKTGYRVQQIFPVLLSIWRARHTEVPASALDSFLRGATGKKLPARGKGTRHPELLGLRQVKSNPPIFSLTIKYRTSLHRSYLNYLEHGLRDQFDFTGTPIVIKMTKYKK